MSQEVRGCLSILSCALFVVLSVAQESDSELTTTEQSDLSEDIDVRRAFVPGAKVSSAAYGCSTNEVTRTVGSIETTGREWFSKREWKGCTFFYTDDNGEAASHYFEESDVSDEGNYDFVEVGIAFQGCKSLKGVPVIGVIGGVESLKVVAAGCDFDGEIDTEYSPPDLDEGGDE